MANREQSLLVVSNDAAMCSEVRRELESRRGGLRVACVGSVDAARGILHRSAPAVILLEERVLGAASVALPEREPRLDAVVSTLAGYAPVVVIGVAEHQPEVASLVGAGVVDFVARSSGCLPEAVRRVDERLQQDARLAVVHTLQAAGADKSKAGNEIFGEVLRHELNNPLTGILGNAELLLAEVRRKDDGHMPQSAQQRLETIAALAVRMREAVRRLSQELESR